MGLATPPAAGQDDRTGPPPPTPLAYRPLDAARVLGISRAKPYQLMDEGEIVGRKLGRRTLILRSELERYIASLPVRDVTSQGA